MDNDPITPLTTLSQDCKNGLKNMRVAVVGAGLGGLMAALRLSQHGVEVKVYEAHPQIGGRVCSNRKIVPGCIIEEGAELIGSFHTAWLKLARKYGIAVINRMGDREYERAGLNLKLRLDNTKDLTWPEIDQLTNDVNQVLESIANEAAKITQETCPWKESNPFFLGLLMVYDHMTVKQALINKHKVSPYNPKQQRLWKMLELLLVNNELSQLDEMNYLGLLLKVKGGQSERFEIEDHSPTGYWDELEIFRCADGSQRLADEMCNEIKKNRGVFELERAVTQIDIHSQDVQLTTQPVAWPRGNLGSVRAQASFDYVVLAIPPTVWHHVTIRDNDNPVDLKAEIGDMGKGLAVKFFSRFNSRFWITEKIPSAPSGGTLKLGQIWEGTDNQMQTKGKDVMLNVFAGPLLPDPLKGYRPPKEPEMKRELRKLYPSYFTKLVTPSFYKDWPEEPFIETGFWAPKPNGEIFKVGPKLNIAFHKRLYFAGEHTYVSYFGYMEGALRSGIRAANLLMRESCGMTVNPCPPPPPEVRVA
ncbi:flavin monoamine oxidase family protein [Nitrosovibrio sp. Nv4]|uniref:flavin monoamine oxidase family protein n=1 Tax=Nitrosovibrio sp. Nv4 TaxID=1945880 RepID=UPI000BCBB214|nr:NAD(P)/FAD-dependent oxidoreductase [Nitrosovibrio sp. Nv4]SOD42736.1 Monoamine oxidase [Nitrosovibrio sp. Nv4]